MDQINDLVQLKRKVDSIIKNHTEHKFPMQIDYQEGMEFPLFTVIIQRIATDVFVDSKGQKWKRID